MDTCRSGSFTKAWNVYSIANFFYFLGCLYYLIKCIFVWVKVDNTIIRIIWRLYSAKPWIHFYASQRSHPEQCRFVSPHQIFFVFTFTVYVGKCFYPGRGFSFDVLLIKTLPVDATRKTVQRLRAVF